MLQKFMKNTLNSEQAVITKSAERQKTSFPREQVEHTDLYKPVLNKIMATQEQQVKYNFVAPLNVISIQRISYQSKKKVKIPDNWAINKLYCCVSKILLEDEYN